MELIGSIYRNLKVSWVTGRGFRAEGGKISCYSYPHFVPFDRAPIWRDRGGPARTLAPELLTETLKQH